jgi:hypothetical protein
VLEEVALGVRVVEGRRDLDVVGTDRRGRLHKPDELEGARRLATDGDRHATGGGCDCCLPDRDALIERHRREVTGRTTGEEHRVACDAATVDQEVHMPSDGIEIDRELGIVPEHRRDRDVAAGQALSGLRCVHR